MSTKKPLKLVSTSYDSDGYSTGTNSAFRELEDTDVIPVANIPALPTSQITGLDNAINSKVDKTITVNGQALSGNVVVAPSDLTQDSTHRFATDTEKSTWNGKQDSLGFTAENTANKATDFSTVNNVKFPTVQASKTYIDVQDVVVLAAARTYTDSATTGLLEDRGNYDASGNVFPSSGGSGTSGAVNKGDLWFVSVAGTLGGTSVASGSSIRALIDNPGQTAGNWGIFNNSSNLGYTAENQSNKDTDQSFNADSDIKYASQKAVRRGKSNNSVPNFRPQLTKWFSGGLSGKKIVVIGDSTSTYIVTTALYGRLDYYKTNGGEGDAPLAGVTIVPYGTNGQTASGFNGDVGATGLAAAIAENADLYVYCFGINDVRLGFTDLATLKTYIRTAINTIKAAVPKACFVLRMPNQLLTTDPGATGFVSPLGSSAAYSTILRRAYRDLATEWEDGVLLDTHNLIWSDTPVATSPMMTDILHPNGNGQIAMVDELIKLIGFGQNYNKKYAETTEDITGWSNPWTTYPAALNNSKRFDLLATGVSAGSGSGFFNVTFRMTELQSFQVGDIVWQDGTAPFQITVGGTNTGGIAGYTTFGMTSPVTITPNQRIRIYRDKTKNDKTIALYTNLPDNYPFIMEISISSAGAGYLDIQPLSAVNNARLGGITTSDTLILQGTTLALTGLGLSNLASTTVRVSKTGDNSALSGLKGYLVGAARNIVVPSGVPGAPRSGTLFVNATSGRPQLSVNSVNYDTMLSPVALLFADVGSVTTAETDLFSYTTLANALEVNGRKLVGGAAINLVNSTSTKQIKAYFAAYAIFDSGALTMSGASTLNLQWEIFRESATVVRYRFWGFAPNASTTMFSTEGRLTGLTLSNTNIFKLTGTAAGAAVATNDIVIRTGSVLLQ